MSPGAFPRSATRCHAGRAGSRRTDLRARHPRSEQEPRSLALGSRGSLLTRVQRAIGRSRPCLAAGQAGSGGLNLKLGFALGLQVVHVGDRSEEHTSELQSRGHLVCRLLLEKKKKKKNNNL